MLAAVTGISCYIYFGQHLRRKGPGTVDTVGQRNCYVLWAQTDGITILSKGPRQWELHPGELFLAEPGVIPGWQAAAKVTRLVFDVIPRERTMDRNGKAVPRIWSPQPDWQTLFGSAWQPCVPQPWADRAHEIIAEATVANRAQAPTRWLVTTQRLGLWLGEYARAFGHERSDQAPAGLDPLIEAAERLFGQRFDPKPSVTTVARQLGVSRGHLTRVFKQVRGHGPGHARLLLQITTAKRLLRDRNNIKQTAQQCGFNSTTGFREAFTRVVGITPQAWLAEQHRSGPP